MKLGLHVAIAGAIFLLNACAGSVHVGYFATCDIGDAQFQRCHDAEMEHVPPICQQELTAASDNHHVPRFGCRPDNLLHRLVIGSFVRR